MKRIAYTLPFVILLAAMFSHARANVTFTASAQRTNVSQGDRTSVVATLTAPHAVQGVPQVMPNDAFDVLSINTGQSQSRNIQVINGKVEHKVEFTYRYVYTIAAKTDNPFTFPPLVMTIDGNNYQTQPVYFNVSAAGGGGGGGSGAGATASSGSGGQVAGPVANANAGGATATASEQQQRNPDVRATLTVSSRSLFVGEQAVLTLKVAQRATMPIQTQRGYNSALEQIERAFGNSFSLNRLFTNQVTQGQEHIGGELYYTFSLRYALFGITPGEYTIPAIRFDYDEIQRTSSRRSNPFFSDFFEMDFFGGGTRAVARSTRTSPLTITIKPLPQNPPANFSGSVGKFSLTASAEPQTLPAGEALTLRVTLRGNTRASNVGDPVMPDIKGADVFAPERQTVVDTTDGGLVTRKTYRYLIVPRDAGELVIGSLTYPYLDPENGRYRTAETAPITITVTPGRGGPREQTRYLTQEEILQVGRDVRHIKIPPRITHQDDRPYRAPHWYILFLLPFLIFLFALIYKVQSKNSDVNAVKNIRQKALGSAVRELNKAAKVCTNDNDFLGKVSIVIEKYISRKFAFGATGRTLEELKEELLSRKIDEQTVAGLTVLIENINEHRFGGKAFDTEGRSDMVNQTIKFLSSMERVVKKEKKTALLLLMLIALIVPTQVSAKRTPAMLESANEWFATANEFYSAGEFDSALVYYAKIVDAGIKNSAVYFNMGNTYHRLHNAGMARLCYEKAAVLSPNDPDILANIEFIKSIIIDREPESAGDSDFLAAVMYNIHTLLSLRAQLILLCVLLFVLAFIATLMLFKRGLARLWFAYGAVLCAVLIAVIGTSAVYKIYALETRLYAIVMTQSLDAKNQPAGEQTLFTVHEGTKLRISKTEGEWSFVSLPNGASGWVITSSLGKI